MIKILIIEDDDNIRESVKQLLEFENYSIVTADNGLDGVKMAQSQLPDIILCDIMMPELDGYEVLKAVRQNVITAIIPFIFLTAKSQRTDIRHAMESGADDYLVKPFNKNELLNAIKIRLTKYREHIDKSKIMLDELRTAISYSIPHEFLTPLNVIIGYANLLDSNYKNLEEPEIHDMLGGIVKAGEKLHNIIKNYIFFVQLEVLESKKVEMDVPCFSGGLSITEDIIRNAAAVSAANYNRHDDLELKLINRCIKLPGNYFEKIINELTDNSFKYSLKGSKVIITTAVDENYFTLSIIDSGRGLAKSQIDKIGAYMQFNRKTYEQPGLGLGLAIVQKIVKLGGGGIEIISDNKTGTNIKIKFPV